MQANQTLQKLMHSPLMQFCRRTFRVLQRVFKGFNDDEVMTRAAALAFYSALSMAPILVLLLWIVSSLKPEWQAELILSLTEMVGEEAGKGLTMIIANTSEEPQLGNIAGLIGLGITMLGASMVFTQLQRAINAIWGLRARPGQAWLKWLRSRLHALSLLLTLAFLFIVSFGASTAIALFVPGHTWLWQGIELVLALAIFTGIFAAMYKVLPDAIISWRDALYGAMLTSILFALGKLGIGIYLEHSQVGGAYGSAGSVVVLLVWVYYSALIVLIGAEFTDALAIERGSVIQPRPHAMRVTTVEADTPMPQQASSEVTSGTVADDTQRPSATIAAVGEHDDAVATSSDPTNDTSAKPG